MVAAADNMYPPTIAFEGRTTTLIVTDECNLRCTYCYCEKNPEKMTWDTARDFIEQEFETAAKLHEIPKDKQVAIDHRKVWEFIGGEPLLEASLVFRCIDLIERKTSGLHVNHPWKRTDWPCDACGFKHPVFGYRYMLSTNGLLLNDTSIQRELLRWVGTDKMHIAVTLDGNHEIHDMCRKDTEGQGSWDRAMKAWMWLRRYFPSSVQSTKSTIAHENLPYISDLVRFFYDLQPTNFYLAQNCVFENVWWQGDQILLFDQLCEVADFLLEGRKYEKFMVRWFNLKMFGKSTNENNWCGASRYMNSCDHTGAIYPCLRFKHVSLREPYAIGSISEGVDIRKLADLNPGNPITTSDIQREATGLDCRACPISSLCADCQAGAYNLLGRLDVKSPFICPMHRAAVFANVYFFGRLSGAISVPNDEFKSYLRGLLEEYTARNYFGYMRDGVPSKPFVLFHTHQYEGDMIDGASSLNFDSSMRLVK